ncbi:uncharacterized protein LOC120265036 [Dioscorea cayenensis subsp. rotundata]|uniref:Uncharacterized protein LOC120265036 n=1 Tax=Dioscorea cayennensis subsp. rotundata TaxID=55577 RepID=A0AB40BNA6_DIOCR|nr:uncharacterized protein LOC120265036 [Dioscorea cayenensis subsp. rotundata]
MAVRSESGSELEEIGPLPYEKECGKDEDIPILFGTKFKDWIENSLIVLSCMNLDLSLLIEQPPSLLHESSLKENRNIEKWYRSNLMSLMIIKHITPESFRGVLSEEITNAKDFLVEIEKHLAKNDKAKISMLLQSLISMKYKVKGDIREYIKEMSHLALKLKDVEFGGRNKVGNIIFKEMESVSVPIVAFDNVHVSITVIDQEVYSNH